MKKAARAAARVRVVSRVPERPDEATSGDERRPHLSYESRN